jgi:hypothetical protein
MRHLTVERCPVTEKPVLGVRAPLEDVATTPAGVIVGLHDTIILPFERYLLAKPDHTCPMMVRMDDEYGLK